MRQRCLVVLEVSKKQEYIFRSNRLLENIGGSFIIEDITENMPYGFIKKENGIYEGGGKSLFSFGTEEEAKSFIRSMSREVLIQYPGVELFMTCISYDDEKKSLIEAIDLLYKRLEQKKAMRQSSFHMIGIGMNRICPSTQLPANKSDQVEKNVYVSDEVYRKKNGVYESDDQFNLYKSEMFQYPKDLDELGGSKGEKSYIAVVVIDGNRMGKKIEKMKKSFLKEEEEGWESFNRRYEEELRRMSQTIKQAYENGMKKLIRDIEASLEDLKTKHHLSLRENFLPIRPIILAGDDVCFVTDGRIGVDCARKFLQYVAEEMFQGEPLYACGGVALVKSHYPFARAHQLAEDLCKNAKSMLIDKLDAAVIDFHVAQGEISDTISDIRTKQYNNGALTFKPYYVNKTDVYNTMANFEIGMERLLSEESAKSKLKSLRDALRQGKEESERFIQHNRLANLVSFQGMKVLEEEGRFGYYNNQCILFDMIEMMDLYIKLEGAK